MTKIIACKTIEDELIAAIDKTGVDYPVIWIESGLHDSPAKLNARLQAELDSIEADRVLMAFGYCGNALLGLATGGFETVIPRADDCISLMIGSNKERSAVSADYAAYFLTAGWLCGERNIIVEYLHTLNKYGQKKTDSIMSRLYGNYRTLGLLNTGAYPVEPLIEATREIAGALGLEQKIIPGTIRFIESLLTGPWRQDMFIVKPPYTTITFEDL